MCTSVQMNVSYNVERDTGVSRCASACLTRISLEYDDATAACFIASQDLEVTNVFTTGPDRGQLASHALT